MQMMARSWNDLRGDWNGWEATRYSRFCI